MNLTCSPSGIPRTMNRHCAMKNFSSRFWLLVSCSEDRGSRWTLCAANGKSTSSTEASTSANIRSGIPISVRIRKRRPALVRIQSRYVSLVRPSPQERDETRRGRWEGGSWRTMYSGVRVVWMRSMGHQREEEGMVLSTWCGWVC